MLPVSLDHKSKSVLVGNYGEKNRLQHDHQSLSFFSIVLDHPANLHGLRQQLTSNFNVAFASQRVVDWINVEQLKLFDTSKLSPVFVHLKTNDVKLQYRTHAILRFLQKLPVDVIEFQKKEML